MIPALCIHVAFVERIRDEESVLESARWVPVVRPYLAKVRAARDARRPRILLRAADVVRPVVVGRHAIELAVRQSVIRRPRIAAIHGDRRALIDARDHAFRVRRIDPKKTGVGAARRAPERGDMPSCVDRSVHRGAHEVHKIGIVRIRVDLAAGARQLARAKHPGLSAIVGAIQAAAAGAATTRAATAGARHCVQPAAMCA